MRLLLPILFFALCVPGLARAVLIDASAGSGNTSPPPDDPGWAHVGVRGSLTGIYLGNGWVITARHVGSGAMEFGGVVYPHVPGSAVALQNPDGSVTDVHLFRVEPAPGLPMLPIRSTPPDPGARLTMIGHGRNRGDAVSWDPLPPDGPEFAGYQRGPGHAMRWGTNSVPDFAGPIEDPVNTEAFFSEFDPFGGDEAVAIQGDSGGAVFIKSDTSTWELAGVIYLVTTHNVGGQSQPFDTVLYGNLTYAADLSSYREQILDIVIDCRNGLDDDGDGDVDWPEDKGCESADALSERPAFGTPVAAAPGEALALLALLLLAAAHRFTAGAARTR